MISVSRSGTSRSISPGAHAFIRLTVIAGDAQVAIGQLRDQRCELVHASGQLRDLGVALWNQPFHLGQPRPQRIHLTVIAGDAQVAIGQLRDQRCELVHASGQLRDLGVALWNQPFHLGQPRPQRIHLTVIAGDAQVAIGQLRDQRCELVHASGQLRDLGVALWNQPFHLGQPRPQRIHLTLIPADALIAVSQLRWQRIEFPQTRRQSRDVGILGRRQFGNPPLGGLQAAVTLGHH
ncbi:MAG: hypothetical protein R2762_23065 [Bryobacteraceae bacterium]